MTIWRPRQRFCAALVFGYGLFLAGPLAAKTDLERFDLHGHVLMVVTTYPQLTTTHQFNRDGRLTMLELQPHNQIGAVRYAYEYDAGGRLVEEATFDPDGAAAYRKTFRYGVDDQGRPSAHVAVTDDGTFVQAEFVSYDRRGWLSEELTVTAQGIAEKSLFDARGNLLYHVRYFQGRLVLETTYHYDPLDRLKEGRFYASDGQRLRTDRYRYDQEGHRIEQATEYLRQSHVRQSVVSYDSTRAGTGSERRFNAGRRKTARLP